APVEVLRLAAGHPLAIALGLLEPERRAAGWLRPFPDFGHARLPHAVPGPLSPPVKPGVARDRFRSRLARSNRGSPVRRAGRATVVAGACRGPASRAPHLTPGSGAPVRSGPAPRRPCRRLRLRASEGTAGP